MKTIFNEFINLFEHYLSYFSKNASNSYRRRSSLHENSRYRNCATSINHINALILRQFIKDRSFEFSTRFVDISTSCVDFAFEIESSFNLCKNKSSISCAYESFTISMFNTFRWCRMFTHWSICFVRRLRKISFLQLNCLFTYYEILLWSLIAIRIINYARRSW